MEFKKLELSQKPGNFWRYFKSAHFRKTLVYIIAGSIVGVIIFYFTEGRNMNEITSGDIINSLLIGGFFGFFITNSPCARGRC
jgi:RsiW-degrading membrane proteinase PrsW (M82 family)